MERVWSPRAQGDAGELSAIQWLGSVGADVFVPLGHSPDRDLVVERDGKVHRVQVKTSRCWSGGRFVVALCTRAGNQSWNGVVKRLDATRCDYLFLHVGDGRRWFIPARALGGGSGIALGGPKDAEFEVERGMPLLSRDASSE